MKETEMIEKFNLFSIGLLITSQLSEKSNDFICARQNGANDHEITGITAAVV